MTNKESTNMIIRLTQMGHTSKEITEFIAFVSTHNPSEDEVMSVLNEKKDKE